MKHIFILLTVTIFFASCKKEKINIPKCIQNKIEAWKQNPVCTSKDRIELFKFQNQNVYTFSMGNCVADGSTEVFNENCQSLGILGGIANLRKINGVDFAGNATLIRVIWAN